MVHTVSLILKISIFRREYGSKENKKEKMVVR